MQVLDGINDKPIKLDVELAYNQFGQSSIGCNNEIHLWLTEGLEEEIGFRYDTNL